MKYLLLLILSSCTYSVVMNHTEGTASDMVDEEQAASPHVEASATIPASLIGK